MNINKQIFLGGTCGNTSWRQQTAIPLLEQANISYHNPQLNVGEWTLQHQYEDMKAKAEADVQLFVVTGQTRGVASVGEVAYFIGQQTPLALCVLDVEVGAVIEGRVIDSVECDDLNRGRALLRSVAEENRIPVFDNVEDTTLYAIRLAKELNKNPLKQRISEVLTKVKYKDFTFVTDFLSEGALIHIQAFEKDCNSDEVKVMTGRRWFIGKNAHQDDIVRTLFKAVSTWEEHETRELFTFDGKRVFDPHFKIVEH